MNLIDLERRVPSDMPAMLHEREMIIPKSAAAELRPVMNKAGAVLMRNREFLDGTAPYFRRSDTLAIWVCLILLAEVVCIFTIGLLKSIGVL